MTPHVSVVLPVRNGARWLGEAIESVLSQTLLGWELIAVNDGSTDGTPDILDAFARRDGRIRPVHQEPRGIIASLNRGLSEVRAPLLARLDGDDRSRPERLERQMRQLAAHPDIGLLGTWAQKIDVDGRPGRLLRPPTEPDALAELLMRANPFVASSTMMRTELVTRIGGYRPVFHGAEDYDLALRFADVAKTANLPEVLVDYRVHAGSETSLNAIRQPFSARLAQLSARARRATGRDPADDLAGPPDWRSPQADNSFYAEDATLYRLLDLADSNVAAGAGRAADFSLLEARFDELTHTERALAARAMIQHMTHAEKSHARRTRGVLLRLLRRRPGMMSWPLLRRLPAALLR